jgi:hypothetical protein
VILPKIRPNALGCEKEASEAVTSIKLLTRKEVCRVKLSRYDNTRIVMFGIVAIIGVVLLIMAIAVPKLDPITASRATVAAFGFAGAIFCVSEIERIRDKAKRQDEIAYILKRLDTIQRQTEHSAVGQTLANIADYLIQRGGNK